MANNPDLGAAFERDEPAFVPYLAAGDPDYDASIEYVEALARGGADVIELGLPFSEPIAEGKTIQDAIVRALDAGMTPDRYFEFVEELAVDVPLVCMTYYNLIYQYGDEEGPRPFVEKAADVGITGFVVPDLPAEEADPLRTACDEFDLDLVFIVAPTTRGERLDRMREQVSGYVYVQARLGTTGARDDVSDQTDESLARIDDWDVPKAVGFGIKEGDHAARIVRAGADGIIVGSALVDIVADGYEDDTPVAEVANRLEAKARELKQGALRGAEQRAEAGGD
ncbi:tryptophan synthase subunit alpha [Halorientalis regularis]|jgi:tryptophan synthase alpha chain|uniref:Tryptophan synthase alpha chain n=1 Tax=Halorientalis regularis TaxID=660518 RepID=A0A1G7IYS1_9EURY|nr:tryptophan synthase subunit alpha [Halorientalis regularis]SDF17847.1 tryptophan synthase, alpha chain [Halorientalis regularis]